MPPAVLTSYRVCFIRPVCSQPVCAVGQHRRLRQLPSLHCPFPSRGAVRSIPGCSSQSFPRGARGSSDHTLTRAGFTPPGCRTHRATGAAPACWEHPPRPAIRSGSQESLKTNSWIWPAADLRLHFIHALMSPRGSGAIAACVASALSAAPSLLPGRRDCPGRAGRESTHGFGFEIQPPPSSRSCSEAWTRSSTPLQRRPAWSAFLARSARERTGPGQGRGGRASPEAVSRTKVLAGEQDRPARAVCRHVGVQTRAS